jgi:hypothetical protein
MFPAATPPAMSTRPSDSEVAVRKVRATDMMSVMTTLSSMGSKICAMPQQHCLGRCLQPEALGHLARPRICESPPGIIFCFVFRGSLLSTLNNYPPTGLSPVASWLRSVPHAIISRPPSNSVVVWLARCPANWPISKKRLYLGRITPRNSQHLLLRNRRLWLHDRLVEAWRYCGRATFMLPTDVNSLVAGS